VVDTTGAGDAFDAAFLVEFTASRDVRRALARANRLGAHVASQLGAQPAAPDGWPVDVEGLKVEG
jgi:sugar/nucleoside kinase (ribokinase family)